MIHLKEFIVENIVHIFESSQTLRNELRQAVSTWFKNNGIKMSPTKTQTPKEIFRYPLGETDDARKLVKEIIDSIENKSIKDSIVISDEAPYVVGRANGASGTFDSFTIQYKDEVFYITNTTTQSSNLKNKELTPDKLHLASKNNCYTSFTALYDALKPSIEYLNTKYEGSGIYELINELINKIKNSNDINRTGSFTHTSIDEFFKDENAGRLSFDIDSKFVKPVKQGDINCIEKDFGEVLGPFVFFRLFDNVKLVYPTTSNEQLVDYYINGNKISAKQLGGGGKPSGSVVAKAALENIRNLEKHPEDITDETSELVKTKQESLFDDKEIEFINTVLSTYENSIFVQQRELINNFVLSENKKLNEHLQYINISSLKNETELEEKLDGCLKGQDIESFFSKLYEYSDYSFTKSSSWNPSTIAKEYSRLNSKLKWGILFYPLYKKAVDKINEKYGGENDVISSVLQKVTNMKQVYLGIRKEETLKVEIVSAGVSKWKLTTGGMSTNNIGNSKLSIELKH